MVGGNWLKSIFFLFLDHLPEFPNYTFLNFQKKFFSLHPIVELTSAYDTVWPRGLNLKLLKLILNLHLVAFAIEMLYNRSFRVKTSDGS